MTPPVSTRSVAPWGGARHLALFLTATSALFACARGINYPGLDGPRYAGGMSPVGADRGSSPPALRLVTFNIKHAARVDSAIAVLLNAPELDRPDVVALQEVDSSATERVARSLGMTWVYYPATLHPKYKRDFGNAILTRWSILEDRKILLPHLGRLRKTARIATAATIAVHDDTIRVYSAHLGTPAEVGPQGKRDQMRAITTDAGGYGKVIIMGDLNSHALGRELLKAGYGWPTEHNARTVFLGNWDHVFLKGMALTNESATGVVSDNRRASDHRPVWAEIATP